MLPLDVRRRRHFVCQASAHGLTLRTGGYVAIETDGVARLGQIVEPNLSRSTVPSRSSRRLRYVRRGERSRSSSAGFRRHPRRRRSAVPRRDHATGDFEGRRGMARAGAAPTRSAEIGELRLAAGALSLDAGGFDRHSFLCGQSGSGKTYSLGVILEQLLLETTLRVVVLDPNSDFVALGQTRDDISDVVVERHAANAGVVVRSAGTEDGRLQLRFADLDPHAGGSAPSRSDRRSRRVLELSCRCSTAGVRPEPPSRSSASSPMVETRRGRSDSGYGTSGSIIGASGRVASVIDRRPACSARGAMSRRGSRVAGDVGGEVGRRRGGARDSLASSRGPRADLDRDRRGSQRLSERPGRSHHGDRDGARRAHSRGRTQVRPVSPRLDAAPAEGSRAGRLAVRQPRPHADELPVRPRSRRRAVLIRTVGARRCRNRLRPRRRPRRGEDRLASGVRPVRQPYHGGGRLGRDGRLGAAP